MKYQSSFLDTLAKADDGEKNSFQDENDVQS